MSAPWSARLAKPCDALSDATPLSELITPCGVAPMFGTDDTTTCVAPPAPPADDRRKIDGRLADRLLRRVVAAWKHLGRRDLTGSRCRHRGLRLREVQENVVGPPFTSTSWFALKLPCAAR